MKTKVPSESLSYFSVAQIAIDIQALLEQYNTVWMHKSVSRKYEKLLYDARHLEALASEKANIEVIE